MDYKLTLAEYETYSKFQPSFLQKIIWFFWPTLTYIKWRRCQYAKPEDCVDYINYDVEPPKFDEVIELGG